MADLSNALIRVALNNNLITRNDAGRFEIVHDGVSFDNHLDDTRVRDCIGIFVNSFNRRGFNLSIDSIALGVDSVRREIQELVDNERQDLRNSLIKTLGQDFPIEFLD